MNNNIEYMKKVGSRVRQRREELGYSQDELARRSGFASRVSISKVESGQRGIARDKIEDIAKALGVAPSWLMGWDESTATRFDFYISLLNEEGKKKVYEYMEYIMSKDEYKND